MKICDIITESTFRQDHGPSSNYLERKRREASESRRDAYGVPRMSSTTGWFTDTVRVSVEILKKIPGMRGEQKNVRKDDLDWLIDYMGRTKHLPLWGEPNNQKEEAPYIMVDYSGQPWVNKGNHRIMAAAALGWKSLPVEIKYFDGGDTVESGPLYPKKLSQSVTENFADGKKPGRKGLAKRTGVPTKASMTKLRQIAKSSSGEKQRMAHWLANMKAGKKK